MRNEIRKQVYDRFNGHCAYCGEKIELKQMQVDHMVPQYHADLNVNPVPLSLIQDPINLMPSCRQCNNYKSTFALEKFRKQLSLIPGRIESKTSTYRLAKKYGLIVHYSDREVYFYFEKFLPNDCMIKQLTKELKDSKSETKVLTELTNYSCKGTKSNLILDACIVCPLFNK